MNLFDRCGETTEGAAKNFREALSTLPCFANSEIIVSTIRKKESWELALGLGGEEDEELEEMEEQDDDDDESGFIRYE